MSQPQQQQPETPEQREARRRAKAAEIREFSDRRHESMLRIPPDHLCDLLELYITSGETVDCSAFDATEIIEHFRRRLIDVEARIATERAKFFAERYPAPEGENVNAEV